MASFGEGLRRERELRGVSLREIADATKISVRFLEALERDRLEILPGGLFPRAFVRQYAKHLGLDAERLVSEFLYAHPPERTEDPRPARKHRGRGSAFMVGAFLLSGILILWKAGSGPTRPTASDEVPAPPATVPPDRVYPPPGALAETSSDELVITLSARQNCWVAVRVDGRPALDRVLGAGETETLHAAREIVLSVGNAGGLSFTLNDLPGVSLGKDREVRRDIVITHENLKALVQEASPSLASGSSS